MKKKNAFIEEKYLNRFELEDLINDLQVLEFAFIKESSALTKFTNKIISKLEGKLLPF